MSFVKKAGTLTGTRMLGGLIAIAVGALSARLASPTELGAVLAVTAAIALLMRIASCGLGQASQYYGAKSVSENRSWSLGLLLATACIGLILTCILLFEVDTIARLLLGSDSLRLEIFAVLCLGIPASLFNFIAALYALGRKDIRDNSLITFSPVIATLAMLLWAFYRGHGLDGVISAWLVHYVLACATGVIYLVQAIRAPQVPIQQALKDLFGYGLRSYPVFIISFAQTSFGILVGVWFTTTSELAYFALANTFAESLLLLYGAVGPLVLSYAGAMNEQSQAKKFIGSLSRKMLLILLAASVGVALVAPLGLPLIYGAEYYGKHAIVWIGLIGVILNAQQRLLENFLFGRNKQGLLVFGPLFNAAMFLVVAALFCAEYGALALAMATGFGWLASYVYVVLLVWRQEGIHPMNLLIPQAEDIRACLGALRVRSWAKSDNG